jgi:SAM-dependent methyltransferase
VLTLRPEILNTRPGDRVLDLGCGEGRHAIGLACLQALELHAVDLSYRDLHTGRGKARELGEPVLSRVAFMNADGTRLPYYDNTFDAVICSEVLEHIPDYRTVIVELLRVLRPGGALVVSVPRWWPERVCWWLSDDYHANEGGHIRIFRHRALQADIEQLGARRFRRHWAHALHSPYWWLQCLFWRSRERNPLVRIYHRLLVWDMLSAPGLTRTLERWLNPVMGKSVVLYFEKQH